MTIRYRHRGTEKKNPPMDRMGRIRFKELGCFTS